MLTRKPAPSGSASQALGPHAVAHPCPLLVTPGPHRIGKPPSRDSPALRRSPPPPVRLSATDSTDQNPANWNNCWGMILVTWKRSHPATIAYIERRLQEGKTRREANRCLKRYLASASTASSNTEHHCRLDRQKQHSLARAAERPLA